MGLRYSISLISGGGKGGAREGGRPDGTLQGTAFEGRKFGILAFIFISNLCSALRLDVAGWRV